MSGGDSKPGHAVEAWQYALVDIYCREYFPIVKNEEY
jgi:hypothetical protein